jgi:hypothetical protein
MSRKNSTSSISSHKSEGYLTKISPVDRARMASTPLQASSTTTAKSTSEGGGFIKLFGKRDKTVKAEKKKHSEQMVLTSIHAAAAKTKTALSLDGHKSGRRDSAPVPIEHSAHITARQQEMRHPHSGPPAIHTTREKESLPMLTRIVSGDEADNPDEWERMREDWRQRKVPDLGVIEGDEGGHRSGHSTPGERSLSEVDIPPTGMVEVNGARIATVKSMESDEYMPKAVRTHTPIGGRYKRDEKGTWKR